MLQASFHQGDHRFKGNGRQCMANSLTSIVHHSIENVSNWTEETLNDILHRGDDLYTRISKDQGVEYLMLSNLPEIVNDVSVNLSTTVAGTVNRPSSDPPFYNIEGALNVLEKKSDLCTGYILTIGQSTPCYTMAVIKSNEQYCLFDSHSRSETGMVTENGKATLTFHKSLFALCLFLKHLTTSIFSTNEVSFEIAAVSLYDITEFKELNFEDNEFELSSETESEFSGFDSCDVLDENIIQTKLKLLDNSLEMNLEMLDSEVSSICSGDLDFIKQSVESLDDSAVFMQSIDLKSFSDNESNAELEQSYTNNNNVSSENPEGNEKCKDSVNMKVVYSEQTLSNNSKESSEMILNDNSLMSNSCNNININTGDEDTVDTCAKLNEKELNLNVSDKGKSDIHLNDNVTDSVHTDPPFEKNAKESDDTCMNIRKTAGESKVNESCQSTELHENDMNFNEADMTDVSNHEDEDYNDDLDNDFTLSESETSTTDDENLLPLSYIKKKTQKQQKMKKSLMTRTALNEININKNLDNDDSSHSSTEEMSDVDAIVDEINKRDNKQRGRKRVRSEEKWKQNLAKKRRNEGKSYTSRYNDVKAARVMKPPCGHSCRYKCREKFSEGEREKVFHAYWRLGNIKKQRQFLLKYASKKQKRRNRFKVSRRENSFTWSLPSMENKTSFKVCKTFFLNTLSVSDQMVITAHKIQEVGVVTGEGRGKSTGSRKNKTSNEALDKVRDHIKSFPTLESHYCRKDSNRQYLKTELSVPKMYDLYHEHCKSKSITPVSLYVYRNTFDTEFNLGFSKPKKDQCDLCNAFQNARSADKNIMETEYRIHIENKEMSRESKNKDKKRAEIDSNLCVACFDLEQVLVTPKGFESSLYYKRQLNNYNFTLYDLANKDGYSYLWNECIVGRGASEIASCVYHFIKLQVSKEKKKFIFYSDNCIPQNKNRQYVSMLWYCLKKYDLTSIEHKYLEKGHTQNENDSVHSSIESTSKNINIYTTGQWAACIRSARRKHPYIVKEMSLDDFFDFRLLADKLNNFEFDTSTQKVCWNGIRLLKLSSDNQDHFTYKYEYKGSVHSVSLLSRQRRSPYCSDIPDPKTMKLSQLRKDFIPISAKKYNDLVSLCLANTIPKVHHVFYVLLPHL